MKHLPARPGLLALLAFGVALLPVILAWHRYRDEAQRKDDQLFDATARLASERLQLIVVRHLNVFSILRNQLRIQPVPTLNALNIPVTLKQAYPHLLTFGYAAAQDGRVVLQWTGSDEASPVHPGDDLRANPQIAAVLDRAAQTPVPSANLESPADTRIFVASGFGDGTVTRGFVVGWLDVTSLCLDSTIPLMQNGTLTVTPLAKGTKPPRGAHLFTLREADLQIPLAIARGPAFETIYGHLSPSLVLAVGGLCALSLGLVVFQGGRAMQLRVALDAERLRARLVQGFSHEFRTPLSVILSSADLLTNYLEKLDPARRMEAFGQIRDSAKSMAEMVDEILLLSRLESERVRLKAEDVDLASLCEGVRREVATATNDRCPIFVTAAGSAHLDAALLRSILRNLLGNAVKYSPPGSSVRLTIARRGGASVFTVADTGIGIPEGELPGLGEAFHRAANVGDTPGTGLGLAIVRRSATLLGGRFVIESEEGRGTSATSILPDP
jgi:signal transduction histidine kinase